MWATISPSHTCSLAHARKNSSLRLPAMRAVRCWRSARATRQAGARAEAVALEWACPCAGPRREVAAAAVRRTREGAEGVGAG